MRVFLKKELHLDLSDSKTVITSVNHGSAVFLGTNISRKNFASFGRKKHGFLVRDNKTLSLTAPTDRVLKKLQAAGIITKGKASPK